LRVDSVLREWDPFPNGNTQGVKTDEDLLCPGGPGFIQPLSELNHLCFVCRPLGLPSRRMALVVWARPKEDEPRATEVELVNQPLIGHAKLREMGERSQQSFDV